MAFYKLGDPQIIQCDNGKEFRSSCLVDFCKGGSIVLIMEGRDTYKVKSNKLTKRSHDICKNI